jgi:DNA-binding NarL/FixJ family response regulator
MKTLLVDDHAIVRDGLTRLLAGFDLGPVLHAASGREALALARAEAPELIVLDLNLPDLGGLDLLSRLRRDHPAARILVLSMHAEPLYAARALQGGADGYVSKVAAPDEIAAAVRAVARGERYVEARLAQAIALGGGARQGFEDLSARDLEMLRLLAEGRGLAEIAQSLGVAYKTAANSGTRLKEKLGASGTADLVRMAVEFFQPARD